MRYVEIHDPQHASSSAQAGGGDKAAFAANRSPRGRADWPRGAADWLCLAAAPTFAIMALLTGVLSGGPMDMLCMGAHDASLLGGMVPMYGLMSAFHAPPWLKLISRWRRVAHRA